MTVTMTFSTAQQNEVMVVVPKVILYPCCTNAVVYTVVSEILVLYCAKEYVPYSTGEKILKNR